MSPAFRSLADRLGNPLTTGGVAITDADLLQLLAHCERIGELTEVCARIGRTLAHAAQDERQTPPIVALAYLQSIDRTVSELADFRALVTMLKSHIPTH